VNDTNKSPELFLGNPWAQLPLPGKRHLAFALLRFQRRKMPHRIKQNRVLKFCAASISRHPVNHCPLKGSVFKQTATSGEETHFKVSRRQTGSTPMLRTSCTQTSGHPRN